MSTYTIRWTCFQHFFIGRFGPSDAGLEWNFIARNSHAAEIFIFAAQTVMMSSGRAGPPPVRQFVRRSWRAWRSVQSYL